MGGQAFHQGIRPGTLGHGNPAQYDYATIAGYLEQAQPEGLGGVAEAYAMVQKALGETEGNLGKHVQRLNMIWKGGAKELGIADMRMLTEATGTLATASGEFSTAMHSGYTAMKISQHSMPPTSTPLGTLPSTNPAEAMATKLADDKAAQQHLAKTNTALTSAFDQIPHSLTLDLPLGERQDVPFGGGPLPGGSSPGGSPSGTRTQNSPGTGTFRIGGGGSAGSGGLGTFDPKSPGEETPTNSGPRPGQGSDHSVLEGAPPALGHAPAASPQAPGGATPSGEGGRPPSPGPLAPGALAPLPPRNAGSRPSPPNEVLPGRGGVEPRLPTTKPPYGGSEVPGAATPGVLRAGGVLGRDGLSGPRNTNIRPGRTFGEVTEAPMPANGVLKNRELYPNDIEGRPANVVARAGQNTASASMPLGAAGGQAGGRQSEHTRDVQLVEDDDLWRDETEVSPRVIGEVEGS